MSRIKDLTGQKFGRLSVVGLALIDEYSQARWLCECECGVRKVIRSRNLINGTVVACGCRGREAARESRLRHGMSRTAEHRTWLGMKERCLNLKNKRYPKYGGRGIRVCARWLVFENFLADMGKRPTPKHTLDRIDNDGNYEPSNCRWATPFEQQSNRSNNRILVVNGTARTCAEWERATGIPSYTIRARLKSGWNAVDAVSVAPKAART